MTIIRQGLILTATENGYGKRTEVDEFPVQGRGGQGVIGIQTTERNGRTVGAIQVADEDEIRNPSSVEERDGALVMGLEPGRLRNMSSVELEKEEEQLREGIWKLRLQMTTGQLQDPSKVTRARRDLARVLTIKRERERAAEAGGSR